MFGRRRPEAADIDALMRVEALVRARFGVAETDLVLVSEDPSGDLGPSGRMTTVLFWVGRDARFRLRFFKPAAEVTAADLPPAWLRSALKDDIAMDCC